MNDTKKVMYVDDEEINLMLFKLNFEKKYDVITALGGEEALHLLDDNKDIEIVVSDMRMPSMNGIEFIQKAKEKYPNIYFFILTAYAITDEIQAALDSDLILDYFSKPLNYQKMDQTFQKL